MAKRNELIRSLVPRDETGFQFVCYADSCSGVPGAKHEGTFAAVNAVVARLRPQPDSICFPEDEIRGLTSNADSLRQLWNYRFAHEMAWLDRQSIPLYHTTANHTTYDVRSEAVFREVLSHLPRNGPRGQEGLAYCIRRQHLLMVFVNTMFSGLGLHCVQAAIDAGGLRYQLLDTAEQIREWLHWPLLLPPSSSWSQFAPADVASPERNDNVSPESTGHLAVWHFSGLTDQSDCGAPQTLLCGCRRG